MNAEELIVCRCRHHLGNAAQIRMQTLQTARLFIQLRNLEFEHFVIPGPSCYLNWVLLDIDVLVCFKEWGIITTIFA